MRYSTLGFRVFRSALALTVVVGSLGAGPIGASASSQSRVVTYPTPAVQTAGRASAGTLSAARAGAEDARGARKLHPAVQNAAAARLTVAGPSSQASAQAAGAGQLRENFNGVSSLDSEITNFGAKFEPPDQGLCAGNGFVLEPVNSAYTIYHTDGTPIAGPFNVNDLFHRGGLQFTSDPRCYFDPITNTWFATILFIADDNASSTIDISVNPSGDPTTAWTTYSIDTTDTPTNVNGNGCPCFGDQPRFGIDSFNLYLSTDEFSILGPEFNGAQLYAVSKSDLVQLKNRIHFAHFTDPHINGSSVFAIEPATTNGTAAAEYFLGALDENLDGSTVSQVAVWAMTNRAHVASGQAPTLSSLVIGSEGYSVPPAANQKGSSHPIDSGDDRMQQAQFINGTIWAELGTGLNIPGDNKLRAAAAWFNVQPSVANGVLSSASMSRQGYVGMAGSYVLYPAIQADGSGNAAMVVSVSSSAIYPSAAFTTMPAGASNFGSLQIAGAGTGPYEPRKGQFGRWGDYSYASLDQATDTVWLATEYVPPVSSQTTDGLRNWGTEVMQVGLGA